MSHRLGPPPRRLRRPARSAAILIAALLAVGGAACSSASAPPSAIPRTVLVGPSGTIPTPEMATLRRVAERVRVPPTSSAPPVGAAEPASPPLDEGGPPDGPGESPGPVDDARSVTGAPAGPADPLVIARGTWACSYLAVGAASGSTLELRIDDLGGHITPEPGDVVELSCLDGSTLVHQEIIVFDPARPLGSLDELPRFSDP